MKKIIKKVNLAMIAVIINLIGNPISNANEGFDFTKKNKLSPTLAKLANPMLRGINFHGDVFDKKLVLIAPDGQLVFYDLTKFEDDVIPQPIQFPEINNVVTIASGDNHLLVLDTNGDVWEFNHSISGTKDIDLSKPKLILSGIVNIASGHYHSIALDHEGNLFTWGENDQGQLGNGLMNEANSEPFLVNKHHIYDAKRLGYSHKFDEIKLMDHEKVVLIGSAYDRSFAISQNDEGKYRVWRWGNDENIPLSTLSANDDVRNTLPVHLTELDAYAEKMTYIGGSERFTVALLNDGRVIAWGDPYLFGSEQHKAENRENYAPIVLLEGVKQLASYYNGAVALTNDHKIYTIGNATEDDSHIYGNELTEQVTYGKPVMISAHKHHIYYVTRNGDIYGVGDNLHGHLDITKDQQYHGFPGKLQIIGNWLNDLID